MSGNFVVAVRLRAYIYNNPETTPEVIVETFDMSIDTARRVLKQYKYLFNVESKRL